MRLFILTPSTTSSTRELSNPLMEGLPPPCWLFCTVMKPSPARRSAVVCGFISDMRAASTVFTYCGICSLSSLRRLPGTKSSRSRMLSLYAGAGWAGWATAAHDSIPIRIARLSRSVVICDRLVAFSYLESEFYLAHCRGRSVDDSHHVFALGQVREVYHHGRHVVDSL